MREKGIITLTKSPSNHDGSGCLVRLEIPVPSLHNPHLSTDDDGVVVFVVDEDDGFYKN